MWKSRIKIAEQETERVFDVGRLPPSKLLLCRRKPNLYFGEATDWIPCCSQQNLTLGHATSEWFPGFPVFQAVSSLSPCVGTFVVVLLKCGEPKSLFWVFFFLYHMLPK